MPVIELRNRFQTLWRGIALFAAGGIIAGLIVWWSKTPKTEKPLSGQISNQAIPGVTNSTQVVSGKNIDRQARNIDEFKRFAARFAENLKAGRERAWNESPVPSPSLKYSATASVISTDMRNNDSIAYPIVAIAKIRASDFIEGPADSNYVDFTIEVITVTFAPNEKGWELLAATSRAQSRNGDLSATEREVSHNSAVSYATSQSQ